MKDLEHMTVVALAGRSWLDDELDDCDDWNGMASSPFDQFVAVNGLHQAMNAIRPAFDEL
jgi:hypothetical protein